METIQQHDVDSAIFGVSKLDVSTQEAVIAAQFKPFYQPPKDKSLFLPESPFDSLPVISSLSDEGCGTEITRITLKDIATSPKEKGREIVEAFRKNGFIVLSMGCTNEEAKGVDWNASMASLIQEMSTFFKKSQKEKDRFSSFRDGRFNGYQLIQFDNHENIRDPEQRDIFEMHYYHADGYQWPSQIMKQYAKLIYKILFQLGINVLASLSSGLYCDPSTFASLIRTDEGHLEYVDDSDSEPTSLLVNGIRLNSTHLDNKPIHPNRNPSSNLCMFRYQDDHHRYKSTQRCMVHQDGGLLTLLPRATIAGLEILDTQRKHFIPIEKFLEADDIVVIPGQTMERVTEGYIRATTHRVVREPHLERYSTPFEMKPNDQAIIQPIDGNKSTVVGEYLAKGREGYSNPLWFSFDVHPAVCDSCLERIAGKRYKCQHCEDYDLCSNCIEKKEEVHFADHQLESVPIPPLVSSEPIKAFIFLNEIQNKRRNFTIWRSEKQRKMREAQISFNNN